MVNKTLRHRVIIGSVIWGNPRELNDGALQGLILAFAAASWGSNKFPANLDAVLMIEGEHVVEPRMLGNVKVCSTNVLAYQHSIQAMKEERIPKILSPDKPAISLAIGSSSFGTAHLAYWAMSMPDSLKGSAVQIMQELKHFQAGEMAWFDSSDLENVYRDNVDRFMTQQG